MLAHEIPLVSVDDVRTKGGGRTKGEKYGKYALAIAPQVEWIKEQITSSKDGTIRAKSVDVQKLMGTNFEKKNPQSIYWGLKYVLFNEGVVVETGTHVSGDKLLVMRFGTEEDKLPPSLAQYLEPAEQDE